MTEADARACKCCGAPAPWFGAAAFVRSTAELGAAAAPVDAPIAYYRCGACGFLFSDFLDGWPAERLAREIYNDDYIHVDPEFAGERPKRTAALIEGLFSAQKQSLRVLDYGGGDGGLARLLRDRGFADVHSTDPYHGDAAPVAGRFDLVVCVEVFEHLVEPGAVLAAADGLLKEQGLLIFSTKLQPYDIGRCGTGWWYLAPRNGHISLHSRGSLETLTRRHGYSFGSFNVGVHMAWRRLPGFAEFLLGYARPGPAAQRAAAASAPAPATRETAGRYGTLACPLDATSLVGQAEATVGLLGRLLQAGDVAVEAGAQAGALTLALARLVGDAGTVVAYEPQPALFGLLHANLARNAIGNVEPCHAALGDRWGSTWLPPGTAGDAAAIRAAWPTDPPSRIRVETVDGLELTHLALLRIAAAGTEPAVLDGAAATIAKLRPALHVAQDHRTPTARLIAWIQGIGYRLWWHVVPPSSVDGTGTVALLALPAERRFDGGGLAPIAGPDDPAP